MNDWIGIENDEFLTMETSFEVEDQSSLFQFKHAFSEKDVKVRLKWLLKYLEYVFEREGVFRICRSTRPG